MTLPLGIAAAVLLAVNLLAFFAQGWDKFKARRGSARRTPETSLLLFGLPLAALGMLIGMKTFRHKTRKVSFQLKASAVVIANLLEVAALVWLADSGLIQINVSLY